MSPDVNNPAYRALSYDELAASYQQQMEAMLEGGVDAILIETIFDTLNAKAAIFAAGQAMKTTGVKVPVMLSVTVSDIGGRTLSGQTLDAFLASVQHADIFSVGLNCSFGARQLKPFLEQLAARAPYYISAYPNAGLPNSLGKYDQTPADMAHEVKEYIHEGLSILSVAVVEQPCIHSRVFGFGGRCETSYSCCQAGLYVALRT